MKNEPFEWAALVILLVCVVTLARIEARKSEKAEQRAKAATVTHP